MRDEQSTVAFPDASSWDELFESAAHHKNSPSYKFPIIAELVGNASIVGFCSIGADEWEVVPRPPVVTWMLQNMKRYEEDTIVFSVTARSNGIVLIAAEHMVEEPPRWLALIRTDTLPESP